MASNEDWPHIGDDTKPSILDVLDIHAVYLTKDEALAIIELIKEFRYMDSVLPAPAQRAYNKINPENW